MKTSTYRIRITDRVAEFIRGMHPHLKRKMKASLKIIVSNPSGGKALKDELSELRSFRVSRFRIIYRVHSDVVEIVTIGPRERIYEETFLILRKEVRK
ncbi:type II toxin-antitoxin system RelE/ParE family toxin [Desulfobacterota bacterium AH_259_B03_O07]|nr:type II toxin-antitoxin system RelE/ParE family toxin [Desulfobacterota bacterium AH_259_B03_O07]